MATAYLNNKVMLEEIIECRKTMVISDKLARMLMLLTARYAGRSNFRSYSYIDEMQAEALVMLTRGILSFNPEKSSSAFSYATTIVHNAFLRRLNLEKRQREIRDELLMDGYYEGGKYNSPSHAKAIEDLAEQRGEHYIPKKRGRPKIKGVPGTAPK